MKITGLLLILFGSNALTATVVAKNMYSKLDMAVNDVIVGASNWIAENLDTFIGNAIGNAIENILTDVPLVGSLLGDSLSDAIAGFVDDKLSGSISEFVMEFHGITRQFDVGNRATVDTLYYVAIAVLIAGVAVLVAGFIKDAKKASQA